MVVGGALLTLAGCGKHTALSTNDVVKQYGQELVAEYSLSPEKTKMYLAHGGAGTMDEPSGYVTFAGTWLGADVLIHRGEAVTLAIRVHGHATSNGMVTVSWMTSFNGKVSDGPSVLHQAEAGEAIDEVDVSKAYVFENDAKASPSIQLQHMDNFTLDSMDVILIRGLPPTSIKMWLSVTAIIGFSIFMRWLRQRR